MNPKLNAIIIEDEEPARNLLKAYLGKRDDINLLAECENGFEGIKAISEYRPDLVFLDIQMPKLNGFEMLELLDEYPEIIFTTAYDQFAIKAFELNAVDYLMKPFSQDRFHQAIDKVIDRMIAKKGSKPKLDQLKKQVQEESLTHDRIFVKTGNHIDVIPIEDIIYIQAQDDYVELHTPSGKFLKKETMNTMEKQLPSEIFSRVHRSSIINLSQIHKLEKYGKESYLVILKNGEKVMVSKSRVKQLKDQLGI
jgi:two-component system LytT family response regulator